MTSYQKAIKALEECVKDAMENDVDPGLQSEIWRHYQGMKAIQRQLPEPEPWDPDGNIYISAGDQVLAAQQTDYFGSYSEGKDVVTFS